MSNEFPEQLHLDGGLYHLDGYPLDAHLKNWPDWPRLPKWPCNSRGYTATWAVVDGYFCLAALRAPSDAPLALLFPEGAGPVPAHWVTGIIKAVRGTRRHVSYPPQAIHDDEVYLEVEAGRVTRMWQLDLRAVPDQSDDELRLSLPRFLWPARLREESPD